MLTTITQHHRTCVRCIMDTTDPEITFNEQGECSHCQKFDNVFVPLWHPDEEGARRLEAQVAEIKAYGRGREYDCILGLSGGVDSSYLAYQAVKLGLRPLAVHIDAGWNSELAVKNIENIVKLLNLDLYTHVVNWEEVRDLQVAFLKAAVANQDVPQDHAFFAKLYRIAVEKDIRYVLSGSNYATESVLPTSWGYIALDLVHLKGIHKCFGKRPLKTFPKMSFFDYYFYFPYIKKMKVVTPLNYMPYNKQEAIEVLERELGWRYYGGKHYESRWTKFFQGYYLPTKFGYDKRKAHLSSLIVAGQMSREEALREMEKPAYPLDELEDDIAFVIKKLGLTRAEYDSILALPNKSYKDYPSNEHLYKLKNRVRDLLRGKGLFK